MRDVLGDHIGGDQVVDVTGFAAVWPKLIRVQATRSKLKGSRVQSTRFAVRPSQLIQGQNIRVHVELEEDFVRSFVASPNSAYQIIGVRWILPVIPLVGIGRVAERNRPLELTLVIDRIEACQMMHETEQVRMASWIDRCIEQRFEDVGEKLLEILDDAIGVIHIAEGETNDGLSRSERQVRILETRYLNHPGDIGRVHRVAYAPFGQFIPFVETLAVDGETNFGVLIFAVF